MANVQLHTGPYPSYSHEAAVIQTLAFANSPLSTYWASTPADADSSTLEKIHPYRLRRVARDHTMREAQPGVFVVYAMIDGVVAGYAVWGVPKALWRSETIAEIIYRKSIAYKNAIEDWMFPAWWIVPERFQKFREAQVECIEKFCPDIDHTWYLKVLCVHPSYQRKGVGTVLVNWGLKHAQARGENAYLEASDFGKGLYIKLGFREVGDLEVEEGVKKVVLPCMLWEPSHIPGEIPQVI
jgi:ribosomal protein S18 acetylase RimI-like enzyme